jgi:hypothetical protein
VLVDIPSATLVAASSAALPVLLSSVAVAESLLSPELLSLELLDPPQAAKLNSIEQAINKETHFLKFVIAFSS